MIKHPCDYSVNYPENIVCHCIYTIMVFKNKSYISNFQRVIYHYCLPCHNFYFFFTGYTNEVVYLSINSICLKYYYYFYRTSRINNSTPNRNPNTLDYVYLLFNRITEKRTPRKCLPCRHNHRIRTLFLSSLFILKFWTRNFLKTNTGRTTDFTEI